MVAFVAEQNYDGGYGATATLPYVSSPGNTLVLFVASSGADTVTDTAGNTWSLAADTGLVGATAQRTGQVYYCVNAKPVTAITLTSAASTSRSVKLTEWSGVRAFGSADVRSNTPPPVVTAAIGDMVIAAAFSYSGVPSYASGYKALPAMNQKPKFNVTVQYAPATIPGAVAPTFSLASAGLVTLRLTPVAPLAPPTHFRLVNGMWRDGEASIFRSS